MKVGLIGAGAIGGLLASYGEADGVRWLVHARGQTLSALRSVGFVVAGGSDTRSISIDATDCLADLAHADLILVAVKSPALPAVAAAPAALPRMTVPIVLALNGIPFWLADEIPTAGPLLARLDSCGELRGVFARNRLVSAIVYAGAQREGSSFIVNTTPGRNRIVLGKVELGVDERVARLISIWRGNGLDASITTDLRAEIWAKLISTVSLAPIGALTGFTNLEIVLDPELRSLAHAAMSETIELGRQLGLIADLDLAPWLDPARHAHHRSSMLQDLDCGRPLEIDSSLIAVRDLARANGVSAPNIEGIAALLAARATNRPNPIAAS
jgi:2-dehydropantoate 2-reductase